MYKYRKVLNAQVEQSYKIRFLALKGVDELHDFENSNSVANELKDVEIIKYFYQY